MSGTEGVMAVSIEEWNANNTEIKRLQQENHELRTMLMEQARLNGMGGERELRLRAEIATLTTLLKAASYHVEGDGDGGAALLAKIRAVLKDTTP